MAEVVIAGHTCLDIIPLLDGGAVTFAPGRLIEAGPAVLATGGAVPNTGLALFKLGLRPHLIGKLGADLFGQAMRQLLAAHDPALTQGLVQAPGETTSYTIIISPPGADRMFIHAPGCNATFSSADVDYATLEQARLFHFGYPPLMERTFQDGGAELAAIFRQARAAGVTTTLDMSMPDLNGPAGRADWPAILAATLPYVDIFLPSVEELLLMLRRPLFERLSAAAGAGGLLDRVDPPLMGELAQTLLDMGARVVGLKAGHRGLYLRSAAAAVLEDMGRARPADVQAWADRELWAPCYATRVVGTTGSGDATIAGFILGLLRGMPPPEVLNAACAVGACNVEAADAISGLCSWEATAARMRAGWPRLPLQLDAPGWRWDERLALFRGPADQSR